MRIAVIGDVHAAWTEADSLAIDALRYDLVLFVGDLGDPLHTRTLATARAMSTLSTRALLLPGNHDGTSPLGVLAEATGRGRVRPGAGQRGLARMARLQKALGPIAVVGYSMHPLGTDLTLIAARPHAMDGRRLCFEQLLEARHGVPSMGASIRRLQDLVDAAPGQLVFLAHNGPLGLGAAGYDPWALRGRDLGDPDLAAAVAWARRQGRQVLAVVAGHLHHTGRDRRWIVQRDGVLYVNAARVPRVFERSGRTWRHHVELELGPDRATAREILTPT